MERKPHVRVSAALISQNGRYLITRRKPNTHLGGLWEFPGGKCKAGESLEDCVCREVFEELGIKVCQPVYAMSHYHEYPEKTVDLVFFECTSFQGEPMVVDCADFRWVSPKELCEYEFPPADLPVIQKLLRQNSRSSNL